MNNKDRLEGFNKVHGELTKETYERVGRAIEWAMEIDGGMGIEINDAVYALEQEVYNKTVDHVLKEYGIGNTRSNNKLETDWTQEW